LSINEQPPEVDVSFNIAGVDASDIVFAETSIEAQAFARPGSATIVVRGSASAELGSEVTVEVGGERIFGGILLTKEYGNFMPAGSTISDSTKTTLHAADFNILLDKGVCYNKDKPKEIMKTYEPGTTDIQIISDYWTNYLETDIALGTMQSCGTPIPAGAATEVAIANGYSGNGYIVGPGATIRALLEEISSNISSGDGSDEGAAIGYSIAVTWYVDAYKQLYWGHMESNSAPFAIDLSSGIARDITVTHDISQLKNDVLCWALERAPLKFKRTWSEGSVAQYGRFQYAEHLSNSFSQAVVTARAKSVANMNLNPTRSARFTTFTPGLVPGQVVSVLGENMPIRSVNVTFPTPKTAKFDVECILETNAPWRYWMSLARASRKGMEQPTFSSADISELTAEERLTFVALPGWHLVESLKAGLDEDGGGGSEVTDPDTGGALAGTYRTLVPFIKGSLVLVINGMTLRYYADYTDFISSGKMDPDKGMGNWTGHFKLTSAFMAQHPEGIEPSDIECRYSAMGPRTSTTVG
jgi:hypothetical protein